MKKIALLGLVCFALSGCGDDKVTKEYLVGDWRCVDNEYKSRNSGTNQDFGNSLSSFEDTLTFRIINNELYKIGKDKENNFIDLSKLNSVKDEISENYKTHIVNTIKVIDKNRFKKEFITEIKDINNNTNIIDLRTKLETTCIRIK